MSRATRAVSASRGAGLTVAQGSHLLIMLGPIVGVAAMVGAVGLTESAKGDLKEKLAELGTNLIIAEAGGTFGSAEPDVARGRGAPGQGGADGHERRRPSRRSAGVVALPNEGRRDYYRRFPVPVLAADIGLPQVLEVPMQSGRWLRAADREAPGAAVVLGAGLADQYGFLPARSARSRLNDIDYGVVGVLGSGRARPEPRQRRVRHAVGGEARLRHRGQSPTSSTSASLERNHAARRPTRSPPPSASAAPTRSRRRCRAMCSRRRRRPTRRCSRPRCSPGSSRSPSAGSASPT